MWKRKCRNPRLDRCVCEWLSCALPTDRPCEVLQVVKIATKGPYTLNKIIRLSRAQAMSSEVLPSSSCHMGDLVGVTLPNSGTKTPGVKLLYHNNAVLNDKLLQCCSTNTVSCWELSKSIFYGFYSYFCLLPLSRFKIESFERSAVSCRLLAHNTLKTVFFWSLMRELNVYFN